MDMNESKFRLFNQFMSDQIFLLGESGELSKRLRSEAAEVEGWVFLGPLGPLVEPSISRPPVLSVRDNFSRVHIYRHRCLMNHQKSHQTNPMAQRDPIDAPLTPWDPVGLPLDPLGPCRPTP